MSHYDISSHPPGSVYILREPLTKELTIFEFEYPWRVLKLGVKDNQFNLWLMQRKERSLPQDSSWYRPGRPYYVLAVPTGAANDRSLISGKYIGSDEIDLTRAAGFEDAREWGVGSLPRIRHFFLFNHAVPAVQKVLTQYPDGGTIAATSNSE